MPTPGTSFVAAAGNPGHRLRVEHDRGTLLVTLSAEDGEGCTVPAVDRRTRRSVVSQSRRQIDATEDAYAPLRGG
jgi:2-methylaconitate cis-trans-isomerase PrpF